MQNHMQTTERFGVTGALQRMDSSGLDGSQGSPLVAGWHLVLPQQRALVFSVVPPGELSSPA